MEMSIETIFDSKHYQLLTKIGEGGFGSVYKAKQLSTQQFVAIKFLTLASHFDEDKKRRYIERFHRESDLVRRLNHPNIVCLIDQGQQGDSLLYAVYEYIDGFSLKEYLTDHGPMDAPQAAEIMACVLDALSHAHDQGVIHRDIKPANIMLYNVGAKIQVKVLDFGIGTLKNEARQLDYKTLTLTQETLGTPSYSAPEQLRGEPPVPQTDIYVWGLVFLECLTATPTITGSSLASIFHQQLSSANIPLGILAGHHSANFFRRVLNKKARERPDNTAELYHNFRQLNFNNLVGDLSLSTGFIYQNSPADATSAGDFDETLVHNGQFSYSRLTERKQISVLSLIITTEALTTETSSSELLPDQDNHQDVIDTFHSDQMQQCIDIAMRYGANHVGTLGDTLLFYFGYPHVTDNDSRLCSRAALDIASNINKKNALLKNSQGISSHIQMGMQVGLMLSLANNLPEGKAAHDAMRLCRQASAGQILCSENVKNVLEGYLHFEAISQNRLADNTGPSRLQVLYQLRGERQSEAFGFLRGTRKNHAFIGREQELARLTDLLALKDEKLLETKRSPKTKASEKAVKLAHVHGEAGIGKSRLVFELRARASAMQHFVAQCLPEHQNNALYPILHCLKFKYSLDALSDENSVTRLQQATALTSLTREHQQHGLQVLTAWLNLPLKDNNVLGHLSPEIQKQRLFALLSQLFCQTSQIQGVNTESKAHLFLFEDLHWADPTSEAFINYMLQTDEFVLGQHTWINTSREPLPMTLADLPFTQVFIEKFTQDNSNAFIHDLFEQQTLAKGLSGLLIERTDGIPLFIEELASTLKKQKLVHKVNGIVDFINGDKQSQVPATLRDSLQQKLDRLKFSKDTAQLAATIGRAFDYDLLAAASNKDETQVQTDLDELITAEIIYLQRQVDGDSYIFKHALVKDAAYESIVTKQRQQSHGHLAKVLQCKFPERSKQQPHLLAHHYTLAQQPDNACDWLLQAGDKAFKVFSHQEYVRYYDKAVAQSLLIGDIDCLSARQQNRLFQAYKGKGQGEISLGHFQQGRKAYAQALLLPNEALMAKADLHYKLGKSWATSREHQKALEAYQLADNCLDGLDGDQQCQNLQLKINTARMNVYYSLNDTESMKRYLERHKSFPRGNSSDLQKAHLFQEQFQQQLRQHRYVLNEKGLGLARAAWELVSDSQDVAIAVEFRFNYGLALYFNRQYPGALEVLLELLSQAKEHKEVSWMALCLTYLAIIYRQLGEVEQTRDYATQALEYATKAGINSYIAAAKANLAWVALRTGSVSTGKTLIKQAEHLWQGTSYPLQWLGLLLTLSMTLQNEDIDIDTIDEKQLREIVNLLLDDTQQCLPTDITKPLQQVLGLDAIGGTGKQHLLNALTAAQGFGYI